MLLYGNKFSVSPITTHIPLKNVNKKIKLKTIINNVLLINNFYKNKLKVSPKIAITGLNPHCETSSKYSEELRIIKPAIKRLRKQNINILGPYPTDTFFLKENLKHFNVLVGMYHDQILPVFKTVHGFNAVNITFGLTYLRMSPDHGTASKLMYKNKANLNSLKRCINLFNKIIFLLNLLAVILLLLSYTIPFLPPSKYAALSVLSLGVPLLLLLNALFVIYWTISLKSQLFLSLLVLILGISHINSSFNFNTNFSFGCFLCFIYWFK